ncbi:hypothetical protein AG1IA_03640 [Rhizoctonia solani AG-1 IA]|uniref:Uncharacterized protein n=1 Tax=Thanatephorus cucumeris (strain AG1-IA) TaxID=983506 RepID=L8WWJ5_THACA|nr:hypothetical protein AG1IA_03640 [Rhizoctonia solani AG-1 IA]
MDSRSLSLPDVSPPQHNYHPGEHTIWGLGIPWFRCLGDLIALIDASIPIYSLSLSSLESGHNVSNHSANPPITALNQPLNPTRGESPVAPKADPREIPDGAAGSWMGTFRYLELEQGRDRCPRAMRGRQGGAGRRRRCASCNVSTKPRCSPWLRPIMERWIIVTKKEAHIYTRILSWLKTSQPLMRALMGCNFPRRKKTVGCRTECHSGVNT